MQRPIAIAFGVSTSLPTPSGWKMRCSPSLGTATGVLAVSKFFKGAAAHDADDRIIYNPATGVLIYDANGNHAGGAVQFATMVKNLLVPSANDVEPMNGMPAG